MNKFSQFWAKIEALHSRRFGAVWFAPLRLSPFILVLAIIAGLVSGWMSWSVRDSQYQTFERYAETFYLDDGIALFTTTDAPYFVGIAQSLKQDDSVRPFHDRRLYPHAKLTPNTNPDTGILEAPLLSVIIASFSNDSSLQSLFATAHAMLPITAFLTAIMIMIGFGAAGFWLEGAIAGAGGALSFAYLTRSSAGRIDTDQLNLGCLYLLTGLAIYTARTKSLRNAIAICILAGGAMWLFRWWYPKPFLGWMVAGGLIFLSFICHRQIGRTIVLGTLFLLVSGVGLSGFSVASEYLVDKLEFGSFIFPNTFSTITEISVIPFGDMLSRISGHFWLSLISLAGLGLWGIRHPALMVVFGPVTCFALLNFLVGNRAIFYSAPMLWFGFAWLMMRFGSAFDNYTDRLLSAPSYLRHLGVSLSLIGCFSVVWLASPTSYLQRPTFSKQVIEGFSSLATPAKDADKVIISWWDYGYAANVFSGQNVVHDGGSQTSPATFLVANALLEPSAEKAARMFKLIASAGYERALEILYQNAPLSDDERLRMADQDIYLILTKDMSNWMGSISTIGFFDINTGKPRRYNGTSLLRYEPFECINTALGPECNGLPFNSETGQFGDVMLSGILYTEQGKVITGKQFDNPTAPFFIQAETAPSFAQNLAVNKRLFVSLFNQMYHLGQIDQRFFSLIYDDFPHIRIFKLK